MRMFNDLTQYSLTMAMLAAPAILFYGAIYWISRRLMPTFRLGVLGHLTCIVLAIGLAPFVALFVIDRPIELQSGKALYVGFLTSLGVLIAAQSILAPDTPSASAAVLVPIIGGLLLLVLAPYVWLTSPTVAPALIVAAAGFLCLVFHFRGHIVRAMRRHRR